MNSSLFTVALAISAFCLVLAAKEKCQPGINCRLPHCRCAQDKDRPGNFSLAQTPQIVTLAFSYALNRTTISKYLPLLKDIVNPNDCPIKGTFFSQDKYTDISTLKYLYHAKQEIGLTTADAKTPHTREEWVESLFKSTEKLYLAGIPMGSAKGVIAPLETMGGDNEMDAMLQLGLNYDTSCVNDDDSILWPYTYDFLDGNPKCGSGAQLTKSFPGIWQFTLPEMKIKSKSCSTLSECSPYVKDNQEAFTLLYNTYFRHHQNGRVPMVIMIDEKWMASDARVLGLRQFLEVIGRFEDTWMVTMTQALEWIRQPVPMYKGIRFGPWECSQK